MNAVCISTKMFTSEREGGKIQGVRSTSKSRGKCPPVYPRIYAHGRNGKIPDEHAEV